MKEFKFRKHDSIGREGAEEDTDYLADCFYDMGDLDVLKDCNNPKRIVLGRTGIGKSALLQKLIEEEEHLVNIEPDELSLQFLSNSTILRTLSNLDINLDLFYKLLWKHIFVVELIKLKFNIRTKEHQNNFLIRIYERFLGEKRKEKAMNYLIAWGSSFWKDTRSRIQEVTENFENQIKSALEAKGLGLGANLENLNTVSTQYHEEFVQIAQEIVNEIQIIELKNIINTLSEEYFNQSQPRYYIVIDRLDENWIDDNFRYRLIRALIEIIKDFTKSFKNAKIVIALRRDLLDRVIRLTRDPGFQEEKFEPFFLNIKWNQKKLFELLDQRINKLVRNRYTKQKVNWKDLLPKKINKKTIDDYIIERTMYRPRDIIVFFNCCIEQAIDKPKIQKEMLTKAEGEYSRKRLRSLADEWYGDYPNLLSFTDILKNTKQHFKLSSIGLNLISDKCIDIISNEPKDRDILYVLSNEVFNESILPNKFRTTIFKIFYDIGLIGIKTESFYTFSWSYIWQPDVSSAEITEETIIAIHPGFYRVLGTILR